MSVLYYQFLILQMELLIYLQLIKRATLHLGHLEYAYIKACLYQIYLVMVVEVFLEVYLQFLLLTSPHKIMAFQYVLLTIQDVTNLSMSWMILV